MLIHRREFLAGSSAIVSLAGTTPQFLLHAAEQKNEQQDTVLVVIQLSGGNDGLNTVVPVENDTYYNQRPSLAIAKSDALPISDQLSLHPAAEGLHERFKEGELAIVQGVGYENPNRSHFESMDIWHTCRRKEELRVDGWLGRYLDTSRQTGLDVPGLHLGSEKQPLALAAQQVRVPSISSLERFRLGGDADLRKVVAQLADEKRASTNDLLGFVQSSTQSALDASRKVETASKEYKPASEYPTSELGQRLLTVARLLDAGLRTRIFYLQLDGFDTHARQADAHEALLRQFSVAVSTFLQDVQKHGHADRVAVLGFSEFGRRVKENASEGTDHGAAAPMFLAGSKVKGGIHGDLPSLTDLTDGDLRFHTDFRRVYASVLEEWLGWPSGPIVGDHKPLKLFS